MASNLSGSLRAFVHIERRILLSVDRASVERRKWHVMPFTALLERRHSTEALTMLYVNTLLDNHCFHVECRRSIDAQQNSTLYVNVPLACN